MAVFSVHYYAAFLQKYMFFQFLYYISSKDLWLCVAA